MTPDLRTTYLGLALRSPLVASSSPLTGDERTVRALEEAGAGAIVLPSLFEEEILHEEIELNRALETGAGQHPEAAAYFPGIDGLPGIGDRYLRRLERMRRAAGIPLIASLNAASPGSWTAYARRMEEAGADALELNLYHLAADPARSASDREALDLEIVAAVRAAVRIPVAVKLAPYYSAFANFAARVVDAGADGLVCFNRFYQPDLDLESLEVVPRVALSHPEELRLPLRWIALLRPRLGPGVGLAATSGIHAGTDAVKALLVGADVAMTTSALLRHGPARLRAMEEELVAWLAAREYGSVAELRGTASAAAVADPEAYERANYRATLHAWSAPPDLAIS